MIGERRLFCENIENKLTMPEFLSDTDVYLRAGVNFDPHKAWIVVKERFLP